MSNDQDNSEDVQPLRVTPKTARSAIIKAIKAKKVAMLHGSPAIGKSSILHSIATDFNLKLIDYRLAEAEPTDITGFPYTDLERMKSGYVPMDTFPIKGDPLPLKEDGSQYAGWLLFFDELTSAKQDTQAAAYKVILDRKVGQFPMHEKVAMVAAGNLESDNAIVVPMSTALQSRMVHLELELSVPEWIDWAIDNKIDHRITDFVGFKPTLLYTFSPDHTDKTYASPRTWHFTDDILKVCDSLDDPDFKVLATGCVTEGVVREFLIFTQIYASLPKLSEILAGPGIMPVPGEPSILFALTGSIGTQATKDNIAKLMQYVVRLPIEFQIVTLRYITKTTPALKASPAIVDWITNHGAELF